MGGETLGDFAVLALESRHGQRQARGLAREILIDAQRRARDQKIESALAIAIEMVQRGDEARKPVRLLREVLSGLGIGASFVDTTSPSAVATALTARTRLVFVETPANPTLALTDIAAVAAVCRKAEVPLAVDNTFLTPVLQKPLDLGADISVYSTTKHIEGHNSTVGGALTYPVYLLHQNIDHTPYEGFAVTGWP